MTRPMWVIAREQTGAVSELNPIRIPIPKIATRVQCILPGDFTRRGFLFLLGMASIAMLLLSAGCATTVSPGAAPSRTPPTRVWDNSEIVRTGRWAG